MKEANIDVTRRKLTDVLSPSQGYSEFSSYKRERQRQKISFAKEGQLYNMACFYWFVYEAPINKLFL